MMKLAAGLVIAAMGSATVTELHPPAPAAPAAKVAPAIRMPGFAPLLADVPIVAGPDAWVLLDEESAWRAIALSEPETRQAARWAYAGSLIAGGRGPEAIGVLDMMAADDPDLTLVAAWQRARGVAQAQTGHYSDAIDALAQPQLIGDAESCLWRMLALAETDRPRPALRQLSCALPALNARTTRTARRPFLMAVAKAGLAIGKDRATLAWLERLPDGDAQANLLRGKAKLALGEAQEARLLLERVKLAGTPADAAEAELMLVKSGVAAHTLKTPDALHRIDALLLGWRGDAIEEAALRLSMTLGDTGHDAARSMAAGALLSRYFDLGAEAAPLAASMQARLTALLAPDSHLPLDQAAGLFWDYRDFAPGGIDGIRLVETLVDRLQAASLYGRAADLLQYRLTAGAMDVEKGPLSVRVASLRILDGDPEAAIRVLRSTDAVPYPAAMLGDRRRVEAAALSLLGKSGEALAALDDVPEGAAIQAEIYWRARDWAHLEQVGEAALPPPGRLNEVGQAIVLRHAIALAMTGREGALTRLHARYTAGFARLPTAATFEMLTGKAGSVDPAALARAMGALPTASPAGSFGELVDAGEAAMADKAAAEKAAGD